MDQPQDYQGADHHQRLEGWWWCAAWGRYMHTESQCSYDPQTQAYFRWDEAAGVWHEVRNDTHTDTNNAELAETLTNTEGAEKSTDPLPGREEEQEGEREEE
eukprot:2190077-Rhodomonas_salina.1